MGASFYEAKNPIKNLILICKQKLTLEYNVESWKNV